MSSNIRKLINKEYSRFKKQEEEYEMNLERLRNSCTHEYILYDTTCGYYWTEWYSCKYCDQKKTKNTINESHYLDSPG